MIDLIDMHTHLPEKEKYSYDVQKREIEYRKEHHIASFYSCGSPAEWQEIMPFADREELAVSFGIHPWFAHQYRVSDYEVLFRQCKAVGEIGLDGGLSQAPLSIQKKILEEQLELAQNLNKPIIIHSDGYERECMEMILDFPGNILIHWFSGNVPVLEKLMEKDCYFTLGPDTHLICQGKGILGNPESHQARKMLIREVPLNRVFLETDGLEALAWAFGKESVENEIIRPVLEKNLENFCYYRGLSKENMAGQMAVNFNQYFSGNAEKTRAKR
ncbi:MAG: TatD family hydrolase [Lachnospiraceae bacterium]|nr:TatD family hydrolase [Candidatus Equihabitans merdae]